MKILSVAPVLPTNDITRDIEWHRQFTGFEFYFGDDRYAGLKRDICVLHLQWHAGTEDDPVNGGSVVKIFVDDVREIFEELVKRETVEAYQLRLHTPWQTHEFGFYDPNGNAIFFVEDLSDSTPG